MSVYSLLLTAYCPVLVLAAGCFSTIFQRPCLPTRLHDVDPAPDARISFSPDGLHNTLCFVRLLLGGTPSMRFTTSSGNIHAATFFSMYRAIPADFRGVNPSEDTRFPFEPFVLHMAITFSNRSRL